jgi:hypothetical protein
MVEDDESVRRYDALQARQTGWVESQGFIHDGVEVEGLGGKLGCICRHPRIGEECIDLGSESRVRMTVTKEEVPSASDGCACSISSGDHGLHAFAGELDGSKLRAIFVFLPK